MALQKIRAGEALCNYWIDGRLDLLAASTDNTYCEYPVLLENCWIEELYGPVLSYKSPFRLINCYVQNCDFGFAYFLQGIIIADCVFAGYLDFQAGGHNKTGYSVQLLRNTFEGFVNFFDCWYEHFAQIEDNEFRAGTNLLGAPEHCAVTFDVLPLIQRNTGDLYRNDEGKR